MAHISLLRRGLAEFFATAFIMTVLIGSTIQGEALTKDSGVTFQIVWLAFLCGLALAIFIFGPVSGAHLNPVVTWVMRLKGHIKTSEALAYSAFQIAGAISGSIIANLMFNLAPVQFATHLRSTPGELIGEFISTSGLVAVILVMNDRGAARWSWAAVTAWIGTAFLFTSSTCFANPAVTIGRIFSGSGAGIEASSVPAFIAVQIAAGALGIWIAKLLRVNPAAN
jgi:arsenate reductase